MRETLNQYVTTFLDSIGQDDRRAAELRDEVRQTMFIAGGAIASLAHGQPPKDIDVFFTSEDVYKRFKTWAADHRSDYYEGPNSFRYESDQTIFNCVGRITGSPAEVVGTFDFLHTQSFYYPVEQQLKVHPAALKKELIYNEHQALSPAVSMRRVFRFLNRGYTISTAEVNKIIDDIAGLDTDNPEVIKYNWLGGGSGY